MTAAMNISKGITASQMREIDKRAAEEFGIPSIELMENAGRRVAEAAKRFVVHAVVVVCGTGNNGGDGLVAARYLSEWGFKVEIVLLKSAEFLKGDTLINFNLTGNLNIITSYYSSHTSFDKFDLIIDALLGTGIKGDVKSACRAAIDAINNSGKRVLSVDIPSGLDTDTGEVLSVAVKADETVTMALPKTGLLKPEAASFVGKLIVADIGIPKVLLSLFTSEGTAKI